jgi:hypothetical protein
MFQDKAQSAGNGLSFARAAPKVGALGDAVLGHQGSSLRAGREAVARGVTPLGKGKPLPAKACLALICFTTR